MSASPYTGDVEVGGPADVRELPGLTISKLAVSDMANNVYLLRDTATGEALLIDAAAEPDALLALTGDAALRTVVTTHGHWDHHRALPEVVEATGAETVAHAADAGDLPVPVGRTVRTGTRSPSGGRPSRSSTCAATRRAPSRSSGADRTTPACTPSPATACSRVVLGTQQTGPFTASSTTWSSESSPPPGRDLGLPRPRQGHHARRRASAPRGVARPRLVRRPPNPDPAVTAPLRAHGSRHAGIESTCPVGCPVLAFALFSRVCDEGS